MTGPTASPTMLVVDPCAEIWALVMEQAKLRGLSVITAPDPHVAVAMIDMAVPDVLMTDLFLPDLGGLELIREIRKRSSRTVVLATGESGQARTILDVVRAGGNDYLQKPVPAEELGLALDRALYLIPSTIENVPGIQQLDYRLVLGTNPNHVEDCVTWLIQQTALTLPDTQRLHLRTTLIELIVNAVEHGSLEILYQEKHEALNTDRFETLIAERRRHPRFAKRRVVVQASYDKDRRRLRYAITDEGKGFAWNRYLTTTEQPCDSRDANGRGVFLAKAFFPDLNYNERGTEVTFSVPLP
ncbi:MAG: Putative Response regulator with ATPase domain [Nitrospira sp.]|nr:MAG: Putative Response regulator with ATPase domain [Nitrospira sp.]